MYMCSIYYWKQLSQVAWNHQQNWFSMSTSPSPGGVIASKDRLSFSCKKGWCREGFAQRKPQKKCWTNWQTLGSWMKFRWFSSPKRKLCHFFCDILRMNMISFQYSSILFLGIRKKCCTSSGRPDPKCKVQVSHSFWRPTRMFCSPKTLKSSSWFLLLIHTWDCTSSAAACPRTSPSCVKRL